MSQENVEVVMSLYGAVQRQDYEGPFDVLAEDVVWDMTGFGLPDLARIYHGHEGIREFWRAWLAAWEMIEFKTLTAEDHGEHVLVEVMQRNRGRESGASVDFHYFQVSTVRHGTVTASRMAPTRDAALETVGLSE